MVNNQVFFNNETNFLVYSTVKMDFHYQTSCFTTFLSVILLCSLAFNSQKYRDYLLTEHLPIN